MEISKAQLIAHTVSSNQKTYTSSKGANWTNWQEVHLATVVEILQSIKQSEMSPMLSKIYGSDGGVEVLDVLMKYLYVAHIIIIPSRRGVSLPILFSFLASLRPSTGARLYDTTISKLLADIDPIVTVTKACPTHRNPHPPQPVHCLHNQPASRRYIPEVGAKEGGRL